MPEPCMDIQRIIELLPHRYPFLLIDRVLELEPRKRIVAIKNVTYNEPFFQGHFPGLPVMPGVLIVEAMGQAGGIMVYHEVPAGSDIIIYFMSLDNVKFRRPVVPGDQLLIDVNSTHLSSRAWKMAGKAYVDGKLAAQAELSAAVQISDKKGLIKGPEA